MTDPRREQQLTVAVAQPLVVPGDVAENLRRMTPMIEQAAQRGADLVLFSESHLTGYDHHGVAIEAAIALDDPAVEALAELARSLDLAIVTGLYERADDGSIHNSAAALLPDGRRIVERKHNIDPYEIGTGRVSAGARQRTTFDHRGATIGMLICADSGIPDIHDDLAGAGCDLVLAMTAGLGDADKGFSESDLHDPARRAAYLESAASVCFPKGAIERALEHDFALAACNQAGYDAASAYFQPGHSMVVERSGRLAALIPGQFCFDHLRPDLALGTVSLRCAVADPSGESPAHR